MQMIIKRYYLKYINHLYISDNWPDKTLFSISFQHIDLIASVENLIKDKSLFLRSNHTTTILFIIVTKTNHIFIIATPYGTVQFYPQRQQITHLLFLQTLHTRDQNHPQKRLQTPQTLCQKIKEQDEVELDQQRTRWFGSHPEIIEDAVLEASVWTSSFSKLQPLTTIKVVSFKFSLFKNKINCSLIEL